MKVNRFFSLVFSSSNHDPFEYPDGKIELYEQPKATRNNAAKYADYALGHFFKMAKQSNYWKDTNFLNCCGSRFSCRWSKSCAD